jgi:hypothetical protein
LNGQDDEDKMRLKTRRSDPQVEFDKILSRLGSSTESVKEVERVIETPDTKTTHTYTVEVDPRTGAQKVVERFSTTMKQCSICLEHAPQIFKCEAPNCGALVCAKHRRRTDWYFPYQKDGYVCMSCYESALKEKEQA